MTKKSRRKFADFKAKVILEALRAKYYWELSRKYELHPTQINTETRSSDQYGFCIQWRKTDVVADIEQQTEKLYARIGQLKVENDFL